MIEGSTVVEVAGWGHEVGWGDGGRDLGVGTTVAVGGDEMEMMEVAMVEVAMAEVKVVAVWVEAREEAVHTAAEVKPGAAMAVATEGVVMKEVHQMMVERVVAEMAVVKEEAEMAGGVGRPEGRAAAAVRSGEYLERSRVVMLVEWGVHKEGEAKEGAGAGRVGLVEAKG